MQKLFVIDKLCCIRQEHSLFSDLSFQLDAGEVLLVEGANGSGKSSLLRLLAGLATPASGDIYWQGNSIAAYPGEFKQHLHYIGHGNGLRLDLTVAENLLILNSTLLSSLKLEQHANILARSLSAGQKRKVALAKLFLAQKKLWLLDEPLTALDVQTQDFFLACLERHLQQGGVAIISSHQSFSLANINMKTLRLA